MAAQRKSRRHYSRNYWKRHVKAHRESGLTRAEYCRQQNISYHALTYWQKKFGNHSTPLPALVPVPVDKILRPPVNDQGAGVKIILNSAVVIEVSEHFSPKALRQVLSVLERR